LVRRHYFETLFLRNVITSNVEVMTPPVVSLVRTNPSGASG